VIILDLRYNVKILPKKLWKDMGRPILVYSPMQLDMVNQYRIFPISRLENVELDLASVNTIVDFEP
jgi:hypothetical protein